jgi:hypothetical protein
MIGFGNSGGEIALDLANVDLRKLRPDVNDVFDQHGMPLVTGQRTSAPGLYFCGQITVPTGQLREIGIEAQQIARSAREYLRK